MTKAELTREVVNKLVQCGVKFDNDNLYMSAEHKRLYPNGSAVEYEFDALTGDGYAVLESELSCFDTHVLNRILVYEIPELCNYRQLYSLWGQAGLLKQPPRMMTEYGNTALRMRHNVFVMVGNGCFYAASDMTGKHVVCTSSNDMYVAADVMRYLRGDGVMCGVLWYSYFAEVAMHYPEFRIMRDFNPELIGSFLKRVAEQNPDLYRGGTNRLKPYLVPYLSTPECVVDDDCLLRVALAASDHGVFGHLRFSKSRVSVEINTANGVNTLRSYAFPEWCDDELNYCYDLSAAPWEEDAERKYRLFMWRRLAILLLATSGVVGGAHTFYTRTSKGLSFDTADSAEHRVHGISGLTALLS